MKNKQLVMKPTYAGSMLEVLLYLEHGSVTNHLKYLPKVPKLLRTKEEKEARNLCISRHWHKLLVFENFTHNSILVTLTFATGSYVDTFEYVDHKRKLVVKSLRRRHPNAVIFSYVGRGDRNHRLHIHLLISKIGAEDWKKRWRYGKADITTVEEYNKKAGVKISHDLTTLANYLFNHWERGFGYRRYSITRNTRQPVSEMPEEVAPGTNIYVPPVYPGYILYDTKIVYGYPIFTYLACLEIPPIEELPF